MIKRTVELSTPGTYVRFHRKALVFEQGGSEAGRVPCEDLGVLVVDTPQATFTTSALTAAVESGAAVIFCGRDHLPAGLLLPYAGNTLHTQRLRTQIEAKRPLQKQLWRQIVKAKLRMQAAALPQEHPARRRILALAREVKSGDTTNAEAQGARIYWQALFGGNFRRGRHEPPPNPLLNYGYMVLRASMARALCGAGLHPALGIHHHNRENPFALVDDLLEPYRPFVDARVREYWEGGGVELDREGKTHLLGVLADTVRLGKEKGPLMVAVQRSAASLCRCLAGETKELALPRP